MIEVSALLLTLLAEGTAVLSLILIIWIVLTIRKKGKDKAAAHQLVKSIKKDSDDRLASIKTFLETYSGQEGEELQLSTKKIDRIEKEFFSQLIRLYLRRDGEVLAQMDKQLTQVISAYKENISIEINTGDDTLEEVHLTKIETLIGEKEALAMELQITKTTMGNMMTEFNTMFSGGNATIQTSKEALQTSMAEVDTNEPDGLDDEEIDMNIDNVDPIDSMKNDDIDLSESIDDVDPSAPKSISESDDDFGSIVSSDDVDDLLDGIDLSKEIDTP